MADTPHFSHLIPGFDFLQGLVKNAGAALPGIGQWVAPTLNAEELDKRISELRTVQYWLEQNARMLGATIQALEVQRMTLSTLQQMNVSMGDLRDALSIKMPVANPGSTAWPMPGAAATPAAAPTAAPRAEPEPEPEDGRGDPWMAQQVDGADLPDAPDEPGEPAAPAANAAPAAAAPPAIDPMRWWTALTEQFGQVAAMALRDTAATAAAAQAASAPAAPGKTAGRTSATARTATGAAAANKPTASKPATNKPTANKPATNKPTTGKVATSKAATPAAANHTAAARKNAASAAPSAKAAGVAPAATPGALRPAAKRQALVGGRTAAKPATRRSR